MPACRKCGTVIGFLNTRGAGFCIPRHKNMINALPSPGERMADEAKRVEEEIARVLLTTEVHSNLDILRRYEIITAECAFGMNIFKDLFAGVRNVVGGRSETVQKTMRDSRRTVLHELKREAHLLGANCVVGVDLDYVELSASGNMVLLVATGTAVDIASRQS